MRQGQKRESIQRESVQFHKLKMKLDPRREFLMRNVSLISGDPGNVYLMALRERTF